MNKRIGQGAAGAVVLALLSAFLLPVTASAQTTEQQNRAAELLIKNRQEYVLDRKPSAASEESFPERFDLRDQGYVTPVKLQNPWGTCWGFSAIAAAETSILSKLGKTYEETGLDLSEHHLAWFARTHLEDENLSQNGEGVYLFDDSAHLNTGGIMFTATSLFSSGIGVVSEDTVPYRGKDSKTYSGILENLWYSEEDDWSIPAEYEFLQSFELENSDLLLSPAVYAADLSDEAEPAERNAAYLGYDQAATDEMKRELMSGKAISVAFAADQFMPSQLGTGEEPLYINVADNKWTHYTYDGFPATHAVTIVGWDDSIKRTDFLDHSNDLYGDGLPHQPEGDGAWIVKNSWGAETEAFPNHLGWGVADENGKASGYFYLSYYDRSINNLETFDFRVEANDTGGYIIDQYDYLQSESTAGWLDENEIRMANVFTAEFDQRLRGLSCATNTVDTNVHYQVYLLNEGAEEPEDGKLIAEEEVFYEHAGYHRIDLEQTADIAKGQKYSVVTTQTLTHEGRDYYAVSTSMAANKDAADRHNREQKLNHEESFASYYSKGVVNPGESWIYMGAIGNWNDFSEMIPALQETETYADYDFDNFPIKAYFDYQNEADVVRMELPSLGYAAPAGRFRTRNIVRLALCGMVLLLFLAAVVRLIVVNHKRKKRIAALEAELLSCKKELEAPKAETGQTEH